MEFNDPATKRMLNRVRMTMIVSNEQLIHGIDSKQRLIQEEKEITQNIRSYLSRAEMFAVRMSVALPPAKTAHQILISE